MIRELPREQLPQYDARAKEHHGMLQQLHVDLQQAKSDAERGAVGLRSVDEMSTAEVIQTAHKTQDQSLSAVRRRSSAILTSSSCRCLARSSAATRTRSSASRCCRSASSRAFASLAFCASRAFSSAALTAASFCACSSRAT